jgi:DnaJ-class molecular chaperone
MRNFYDVLAIDPGADDEQIREAFQSLAKIFHPDLNLGDAVAERRFKEICQAYGTLKDPRTRAAYELGLAHQRGRARRRVSAAAMTGFATSMLSTIVIALVMVWLLTDGRQSTPSGQNRSGEGQGQTRKTAIGLSHDQAFAQGPPQIPLMLREMLQRSPS